MPEDLVNQVKAYILCSRYALGVARALQLIFIPIDEGEEDTKFIALIAGIDETTTKKDWLRVWEDITRILRLSEKNGLPSKRPMDPLLLRDLTFWKYKKEGCNRKEIIEKWLEIHPDNEELGEDTVSKAIDRIDKIMKGDS